MVQIICKACDRQPHFHIYRVDIVQYHFLVFLGYKCVTIKQLWKGKPSCLILTM